MNYKNDLERRCFEIASDVLGPVVQLEHNKRIQIENALYKEVASFKGPPAKEVDVLVLQLTASPKITLLISCKELAKRAEPTHVQEWAAVVRTMNKYSTGTLFLGLIVSSQGFTSGCEAWATSHNLGIIPPLKGRTLAFSPDTVLSMFNRSIRALHKRVRINPSDIMEAPKFFDFIYSLVEDFEGHEEATQDGRYFSYPQGWVSSFPEMYASVAGHVIEDLVVSADGTSSMRLSDNVQCRFTGSTIEFGSSDDKDYLPASSPSCSKNIPGEPCTLDFIKSLIVGLSVTSAGDFGDYIEFGIDSRFNLGLHSHGFHVFSTESPDNLIRL